MFGVGAAVTPPIGRLCASLIVLIAGCESRTPARNPDNQDTQATANTSDSTIGAADTAPVVTAVAPETPRAIPSLDYDVVRTYGSESGALSFTEVGPAAANDSGLLVVVDRGVCQLVIIDLEKGELVRRIARCGKGPGEFTFATAVALRHDNILLWDDATRRLLHVRANGEEVRRYHLPTDIWEIDQIVWFDDTTTVLATALSIAGRPIDKELDRQLLVFNLATGSVITRFHPVVEYANGNPAPITYNISTCSRNEERRLVVLENWLFKASIYRLSPPRLITQFETSAPEYGPEPERSSPEARRPKTVVFGAACARSFAFLWHVHGKPGAPRLFLAGGRVELRGYDGQLKAARTFGEADSLFRARPVAAYGDQIILATNRLGPYPHLVQARVSISPQ